jgi:hypothetical protein
MHPLQMPHTLAERVTARVLQLRPGTRVEEHGPLELWAWAPEKKQAFLGNLSQSCDASPDQCNEFIDRFSRNIVSPPTVALTTTAIMPTLKDRAVRLSPTQARDAALANLRREAAGFKIAEIEPGLFGLHYENGYDAAMFVLVPEWKAVAAKVAGDLVVAPLGRDTVFFTGTQAGAAFAHLQTLVEHERQDPSVPYPISTTLYRWRPTGWQRFDRMPGVKR